MCGHLQISRVTLRAALAQLQREGFVRSRRGHPREIVPDAARSRPAAKSALVVLLSPVPLEAMQRFALYWIDDLRERLSETGYHLDVQDRRACHTAQPEAALAALAGQLRPAGWVLYQSTIPVQRWFSAQALPCVITGSRHPGVLLPSVDLDYRAVCRHAAGLLLARGHRHIAFLNLDSGLAGDKDSEAGFLEATRAAQKPAIDAIIANHDGTLDGLCRRLDSLLHRTPPPTGLLVANPHHVLTVLGHLSHRGVRVPQQLSLISRDDDSFLPHVLPPVARYSARPAGMALKVSRLVLEMVRGGPIRGRDFRLLPQFIPGDSLSTPPPTPHGTP